MSKYYERRRAGGLCPGLETKNILKQSLLIDFLSVKFTHTDMKYSVPSSMTSVILETPQIDLENTIKGLRVGSRLVPVPAKGQVLVKMDAAPCNPSDLLFLQGLYGIKKTLPVAPGFEGVGTVVRSGGGLLSDFLVGKRVACATQSDADGTWSEYAIADTVYCIPMKSTTPLDQAATFIVNPFTAVALLATAREEGRKAAIHTAGASQLGRMLITLARDARFPLINLVHRPEQKTFLEGVGAENVLVTSDSDFESKLGELSAKLKATIAFDAVGGALTGQLLRCMPDYSTVLVYGALSDEKCSDASQIDFIFKRVEVKGFYVVDWLARKSLLSLLSLSSKLQGMMVTEKIKTVIQRRVSIHESIDGLLQYSRNMTAGKILITF